jgi:hypothetical protein
MKYKILFATSLALLTRWASMHAQSNTFFEKRNEIGVNTTRLLSNVLALVDKDPSAPYSLYYAKHLNKMTYRLAGGIVTNNSIVFDNTSLIGQSLRKEILDNFLDARFSIERRYTVAPKVALSAGLDLVGAMYNSTTQTENFFFRKLNRNTIGVGPALRVSYKISKRIILTTETNLLAQYGFINEEVKVGSDPTIFNKSNPSSIVLSSPTTLFVGFNF